MATDDLTTQQEVFAQQIGTHGKNQFEAYQIAFPKSLEWKPDSVYPEASKLANKPNVSTRIKELKQMIVDSNLWTKEESVNALKKILQRTYKDENGNEISAAQDKDTINAIKELNVMHGFNAPTKTEITGKDGVSLLPPDLTINIASK